MRIGSKIFKIIFGIVFLVVGILSATVWGNRQQDLENRCTAATSAVITSVVDTSDDDNTSYDVTVEFEINGQKITYSHSTGTRMYTGDTLTAYYDPNDPGSYYVKQLANSSRSMRLTGTIFAVVGGLIFVSGIFSLIRGRR